MDYCWLLYFCGGSGAEEKEGLVWMEQFMCWTLFISDIASACLLSLVPLKVLSFFMEPRSRFKSVVDAAEILFFLLLSHYATNRKVAGSVLDEVIKFLNWPSPSSRTMTLGSTQPLTEMSIKNLPGGGGGVK
jgi:hypothetical protein